MLVLSLYAPSTNFTATEMGSVIFSVMTGVYRDKADNLGKVLTLTLWFSFFFSRDDVLRRWTGVVEVEAAVRRG